jgi:hypothetical protein
MLRSNETSLPERGSRLRYLSSVSVLAATIFGCKDKTNLHEDTGKMQPSPDAGILDAKNSASQTEQIQNPIHIQCRHFSFRDTKMAGAALHPGARILLPRAEISDDILRPLEPVVLKGRGNLGFEVTYRDFMAASSLGDEDICRITIDGKTPFFVFTTPLMGFAERSYIFFTTPEQSLLADVAAHFGDL